MIRRLTDKRGQAIVEMAIFGSFILMFMGILLSNFQRFNDQQYVQMEAFRRTLEKACTYRGDDGKNSGASARLTYMNHRRFVNLADGYRKGSRSTLSATSSVFWAVPYLGSKPDNIIQYRINDEESDYLPKGTKIDSAIVDSYTAFGDTNRKDETTEAITTTRESDLTDTVVVSIDDEDGNMVWGVEQGAYRDSNGQYRYHSDAVDTAISRSRTWETEF
jgi:hypothetical protein